MNNSNSSQQFYSPEVTQLPLDNSPPQHVTSPQSQLQQSEPTTDPTVKSEHENQASDAPTAAKEADTKKKRNGPKRRKVTHGIFEKNFLPSSITSTILFFFYCAHIHVYLTVFLQPASIAGDPIWPAMTVFFLYIYICANEWCVIYDDYYNRQKKLK